MNSLFLHSAALEEIIAAVLFYEARMPGLGNDFSQELQLAFKAISNNPNPCVRIGKQLRKKTLKRFPYTIIFKAEEVHIRILAVAHQKRRPGYWKDRQSKPEE